MSAMNRTILGALSAISLLVSLSGCIIRDDRGGYRYEHGDRVDRYGHREERWCDNHRDDEHCR